jgi:hypothetical protein
MAITFLFLGFMRNWWQIRASLIETRRLNYNLSKEKFQNFFRFRPIGGTLHFSKLYYIANFFSMRPPAENFCRFELSSSRGVEWYLIHDIFINLICLITIKIYVALKRPPLGWALKRRHWNGGHWNGGLWNGGHWNGGSETAALNWRHWTDPHRYLVYPFRF